MKKKLDLIWILEGRQVRPMKALLFTVTSVMAAVVIKGMSVVTVGNIAPRAHLNSTICLITCNRPKFCWNIGLSGTFLFFQWSPFKWSLVLSFFRVLKILNQLTGSGWILSYLDFRVLNSIDSREYSTLSTFCKRIQYSFRHTVPIKVKVLHFVLIRILSSSWLPCWRPSRNIRSWLYYIETCLLPECIPWVGVWGFTKILDYYVHIFLLFPPESDYISIMSHLFQELLLKTG